MKRLFALLCVLAASAASAQVGTAPGFVLKDEGTTVARVRSMNVVGSSVTCTASAGAGTCTFTAPTVTLTAGATATSGCTDTGVFYSASSLVQCGGNLKVASTGAVTAGSTGLGTSVVPFTVTPGTGSTAHIQNWGSLSYVDSAGTFTVPNPGYVKNSGGSNSYLQLGEGTGTVLAYSSNSLGVGASGPTLSGGNSTLLVSSSGTTFTQGGFTVVTSNTSATRSFTLRKAAQNVFNQAVAGTSLTEAGGAETVLLLTSATTNTFDVIVDYRVTATDGTDRATRGGAVRFVCDNAATVVTCSAPSATDQTNDGRNGGGSQFISTNSKTLTYAIAIDTATANVAKLTFNIDSDMTVSAASITMTVTINGTVTPS